MFQTLPFKEALAASEKYFTAPEKYTKADFTSDQSVRWCPGCGDYAILSAMQRACASMGKPQHEHVFVSGIGCSSRFPYYMNAYGFHTIHGRAPGLATGLALTRDDLTLWLITGDGDGLSIGIGHLLHLLRRNVNANVLLFNNRIYGLTKGQYSPTSERGKVTRSSPSGSVDAPFEALSLARAAGATFTARVLDRDLSGMEKIFTAATEHNGTTFIEIYQNCNIFNDGAFAPLTDRETKATRAVFLTEGEPLVYGQAKDESTAWVITWDGFELERKLWRRGAGEALPKHALIHTSEQKDFALRGTLYDWLTKRAMEDEAATGMGIDKNSTPSKSDAAGEFTDEKNPPPWPVPFGLFHCETRAVYEDAAREQIQVPPALLGNQAERETWLQGFMNGERELQ